MVNAYKRPKYASPDNASSGDVGVITAPMADHPVERCKALCRYLDDGRLKPDNNTSENAIRPLALGRKNWLFAGSECGARAAALFLGLVQSCKACQVNPWEYFNDVLRRIMSHPVKSLRELLPDRWQPLPNDERGLIVNHP